MRPASSLTQSATPAGCWRIHSFRLVCSLLLAAVPTASAWAQGVPGSSSSPIWVDQFGSAEYDTAGGIAVSEGDVYVTSYDHGPAYLRKYGADGSLVWWRDVSSGSSSPVAVWADRDRVCVSGTARGPLEGDDETIEGSAGYVRCFDPGGSVLWTRYIEPTVVTPEPQAGVYALAGEREQIVVVGTTTSDLPVSRGRRGGAAGRGSGAFFQKYRAHDGSLLWSSQVDSTGSDFPLGVVLETSGGVDVWGVRYQVSAIVPRIESSIWLRRLDATGKVASTAEIAWGRSPLPTAFALAGTAFYVGGWSESGAAVRRYDWDPQQGLLERGDFSAVLPDAEFRGMHAQGSTLLVAGKEPAPGGPRGPRDAFVRKYDVEGGRELWSIPFGTTGDDQVSAVDVDASRVYVAGYTGGTLSGTNQGGTDAFVGRFAEPFGVDAGGLYSVNEGSTATLSASASAVDYGQTFTYHWDLDGDGIYEEPGQTVAFTPRDNAAEPVSVRVRVKDDYSLGTAEATALVAVANVAPIVDAGPDAFVVVGQTLSRSVVFTDPGADTWLAVVDWGDGSPASSSGLSSTSFTASHVYGSAGTYTVTVTVTDKDGGGDTRGFNVTVWAHPVTIADIVAAVRSLVDQGVLNQGQGSSLIGKLNDAQAALDAGDTQTALEVLNAFVNEVEAYQQAGTLDSGQAGSLIAMARAVVASISG